MLDNSPVITIQESITQVEKAIHALQAGKMILLCDDDDREGEVIL